MPGEKAHIAGIVVLALAIGAIATAVVLSLASSSENDDSDDMFMLEDGDPDFMPEDGNSDSLMPENGNSGSFMPGSFESINSKANVDSSEANIVVIILDDAGWADISHHNIDPWSGLQTPNIDEILSGGLYFSNFYAQAVCSPARGAMMTGRWTWALGLQQLKNFKTCTDSSMNQDIPTWAEFLKQKNYTNYFYGKWHLGMNSWNSTAMGRGWDGFLGNLNSEHESALGAENGRGVWVYLYDDWECNVTEADQLTTAYSSTECMFRSYDYKYVEYISDVYECRAFSELSLATACVNVDLEDLHWDDSYIRRDGSFLHFDLGEPFVDWWRDYSPEDIDYGKRTDVVLTDEGIKKLEEFSSGDIEHWSLIFAYKTPHQDTAFLPHGTNTAVVQACERFFDTSSKYYNYDRGAICQQMWQIDVQIGRIVTTLKDLSLWNNTLILLTNDNGGTAALSADASTEELNYNYGLNWPLRGVKSSYYQGAVKTIMGISGGALPESERGKINTALHHISDITPTILAAAGWSESDLIGISNGQDFDGIPLYSTSTVTTRSHEYIYLSTPTKSSEWKWVLNITAIVLKGGLKHVSVGVGEELNSKGYWGTLPESETIATTWETCNDGCVWNLENDPYEHDNLGDVVSQQVFIDLLDEAYSSSSWDDGITFDSASCDECSYGSTCTEEDTAIYKYGYAYYPPWL